MTKFEVDYNCRNCGRPRGFHDVDLECKVTLSKNPSGDKLTALREALLGEPFDDLSFSEHVATKLASLLTGKYTNSKKIAAGIIRQELETALAASPVATEPAGERREG